MSTNGSTSNTSAGNTSAGTTGPICSGVACVDPDCPDGKLVVPDGACCPTCDCSGVTCGAGSCQLKLLPPQTGACCEPCDPPPRCEGIDCQEFNECKAGYSYQDVPGACCGGCLPDEGCPDLPCAEQACPPGTTQGNCCDCLPDPLYCTDDADCVMANRPHSCCGCPEAVSTRLLEDDECWFAIEDPRPIPDSCQPGALCDVECLCDEPGEASCVDNRCVEVVK